MARAPVRALLTEATVYWGGISDSEAQGPASGASPAVDLLAVEPARARWARVFGAGAHTGRDAAVWARRPQETCQATGKGAGADRLRPWRAPWVGSSSHAGSMLLPERSKLYKSHWSNRGLPQIASYRPCPPSTSLRAASGSGVLAPGTDALGAHTVHGTSPGAVRWTPCCSPVAWRATSECLGAGRSAIHHAALHGDARRV